MRYCGIRQCRVEEQARRAGAGIWPREGVDHVHSSRTGQPRSGIALRSLGERRSEEISPVSVQDHEKRMIGKWFRIAIGDGDRAETGSPGWNKCDGMAIVTPVTRGVAVGVGVRVGVWVGVVLGVGVGTS